MKRRVIDLHWKRAENALASLDESAPVIKQFLGYILPGTADNGLARRFAKMSLENS